MTEDQQSLHPHENPNSMLYARPLTPIGPNSMLYARPISPDEIRRMNDERMRQDAEHRARAKQIDDAFKSPEAQKIREMIDDDGNVEWREFVSHAGGILEVVALVDENGLPDVDRIVPLIDEIFNKHVQREIDAGSVFRRYPRNRPYQPGPDVVAARQAVFPGDREPHGAPEGNPYQPAPRTYRR